MSDCRLAEDTELVAAVAGGKDAAQAVLYDRHHRHVLGVPAPTVRSRLRLGLLKLGGVLQPSSRWT